MKGELRCVDGRLMRHDPQPDDPYLETDRGVCPDCGGAGCARPIAQSGCRSSGDSHTLLVTFSKPLTDDEMRDFLAYAQEWVQ